MITVRTLTANVGVSGQSKSTSSGADNRRNGNLQWRVVYNGTLTGTGSAILGANAEWRADGPTVISLTGGAISKGQTLAMSALAEPDAPLTDPRCAITAPSFDRRESPAAQHHQRRTIPAVSDGGRRPVVTPTTAARRSPTPARPQERGGGTPTTGNVGYTNSGTIDLQSGSRRRHRRCAHQQRPLQPAATTTFSTGHRAAPPSRVWARCTPTATPSSRANVTTTVNLVLTAPYRTALLVAAS